MTKISPARIAAYEILKKIETDRAFSSVLLPAFEEDLSGKDRALCHELTLGVLRKQLFLDRLIEQLTRKRMAAFDLEVVLALRLGLYQMLFLDKIPAYSAINESVNLVRRARKRSAAGLVNAVLRRVSREQVAPPEYTDEIERISVETSHPRWLIEHWSGQFSMAETGQIALANNDPPPLAFRHTGKFYRLDASARQKISARLKEVATVESEFAEGCLLAETFHPVLAELAEQGLIYFQEEASQLVAQIVGLRPSESFIDVCAAPGSKVTNVVKEIEKKRRENREPEKSQIPNPKSQIEVIQNRIVAGDLYDQRVRVLRDNCRIQGAEQVSVLRYDALCPLPLAEESFDAVLVDAPCSGTGTIRHNPEIRYFLEEKDFRDLADKQLKILGHASKLVKRGGRLIYSTCSLESAENEEVIERFLQENDHFEKKRPGLPDRFLTAQDFIRTFPHRDRLDGFFMAVFEKK